MTRSEYIQQLTLTLTGCHDYLVKIANEGFHVLMDDVKAHVERMEKAGVIFDSEYAQPPAMESTAEHVRRIARAEMNASALMGLSVGQVCRNCEHYQIPDNKGGYCKLLNIVVWKDLGGGEFGCRKFKALSL